MGMQKRKSLEDMMDCVKEAFYNGSSRGHEFQKMRHAIIVELKRLGYDSSAVKDELIKWNGRCERPLGVGEQRRQLFRYVDWTDKRNCKLGCNALQDYCIGKTGCQFYKRTTYQKRRQVQAPPFDSSQLEAFLNKRFKGGGYGIMLVAKALRYHQVEKATGELIYVGVRTLASIIRDKFGHTLTQMEVHRKIQILVDEGVIEKCVKGRPGTFSWQANGYRFLNWRHP